MRLHPCTAQLPSKFETITLSAAYVQPAMSQPGAPPPTFASGRYSKRKRTQVNYRIEKLGVDKTDAESEEEVVRAKKPRKPAASRPLPKRNFFPFLQLPAEIRNMIYSYAPMDPSDIKFVAVQRSKRRCAESVSTKSLRQATGSRLYYQSHRINNNAKEQATELVLSLFAVNKQVYHEGCDILYSNELIFADPIALYSCMINLDPSISASRLKIMRLKGWGYGSTLRAYNNACFAVLIWANNLKKFYIDCSVGQCRESENAAQQTCRDAFPWLEAVGRKKARFDAALDVLEVSSESLARNHWSNPQDRSGAQRRMAFNKELGRTLELQQKRVVVNKSVKKRKVAKVSGIT
ncbi:uncharacterized protein M421DRAFT_415523 [Didymella exigua CBS 183.55]|uniref:DUF7730 domain-containing protein n=1 Tax=Didymella exigua CBS 183.55 TaxID=1150837 RepID=A0A6A5S0P4_9PLEO|nr:uncharacterized protein M421DRAFT_415523 [Didymella exigua CBS 183.55]KAF1933160.1 hypothetical protein M421DRAFT_415523 [Didymella exigua CBS 183.55]